ncbi:Copper export regulator [Kingella potus]|uniref:Copper export regulator n=1 Tax=Kingella potus TaxID=265175 RepID=A0A377QXW1_9NEIS|nr:MerR family DNA-binding transcriptional regulator [Kingella potus]UOP01649.1 MerR family DNA-binding transcriptional regulator [Kingella potus]STR00053.1 Copper export regulator [Kingella potus]
MKIGEFSRQSGISVRMLRFYETAGLLTPRRTAQGWREYDAADVAFVRKAALLNRAGVPLKDLALMRDCLRDEPQDFCTDLRARLAATREQLAEDIARLQQSERLLADLLVAG